LINFHDQTAGSRSLINFESNSTISEVTEAKHKVKAHGNLEASNSDFFSQLFFKFLNKNIKAVLW
jgi:hypothetical protein